MSRHIDASHGPDRMRHPPDLGPEVGRVLVDDPALLLALFARDREVHPYGLADVEQLWDVSHWWMSGAAAVGLLDLPGSPVPVVYAVSAREPEATLDLLLGLDRAGHLPDGFVVTGPRGLASSLADRRTVLWSTPYEKMVLRHPDGLPEDDTGVVVLGHSHVTAIRRLHAADPTAGDFFHPALLDTGYYLGILHEGAVLASAGVHVVDPVNSVAAIGNVATHPDHRGRGLARRVTGTLTRRLLAEVEVIGLNVAEGNVAAGALYRRLGFEPVLPYEEAELGPAGIS